MSIINRPSILVLVSLFTFELHAQGIKQEQVLDVDFSEFCKEEEAIQAEAQSVVNCETCIKDKNSVVNGLDSKLQDFTPLILAQPKNDPEAAKKQTCRSILKVAKSNPEAQELKILDQEGNPWKIRFHFGHSRMFGSIKPNDVKITSSQLTGTIKEFTFKERTSDWYYNPTKWKEFSDASKWIDEPSNTFTISIENNKNSFYITAYHPKLLKSYYEKKEMIDGVEHTSFAIATSSISDGTSEAIDAIPEGTRGIDIQNTHKLMVWQIGYGRKFKVFDTKKAGKMTYVVRADAGIQTGAARAIIVDKTNMENVTWVEKYDDFGIQGYNADIGHRVEYQRGRFGVFIDQKMIFSKIEHGFMDGTAAYNQQFVPTTFGVSLDLMTLDKKKKQTK